MTYTRYSTRSAAARFTLAIGVTFAAVVAVAPAAEDAKPAVPPAAAKLSASDHRLTGLVEASWYNRIEQVSLSYTALATDTLLYVGGSMFPREVQPGSGYAFQVTVQNVGCAASAPLSAATTSFQWSYPPIPACTYQAFLPADAPAVPAGAMATLTFANQTIPAACVLPPDIVVTPTFSASYSGLFKTFFDVLEEGALDGTPVLIAATGGTARHSLVLELALRPLFSYLHAVVVPTGVFAATEDFDALRWFELPEGSLAT